MKSPLPAPLAGLLAALLAQAAAAQCAPAAARAPGTHVLPGVVMASFIAAPASPAVPAAPTAPIARQESGPGQATGLRLVLAGLALMAGIALGRRAG